MKNYTNHLKKISKKFFGKEITFLSTFNGIGAFSEALKQLGINATAKTICEIDDAANSTYFKNFPEHKNKLVKDVNDLEKNVQNLGLDILVQSPPCQSFSLQGKRLGLDSKNGNLFLTAINLQKKADANIVIYENVQGLVSHDKKVKEYASLINPEFNGKGSKTIGHTLHTIETLLLEDSRYNYYWKVINSADQGLPQNRTRIFIVGIKKALDKGFKFPENQPLAYTVEDVLESNPHASCYYPNKAGHKLNPTGQERREGRMHTIAKYDETMSYEATRRVYAPYVSPCITTGNNAKFMIYGKVRTLDATELKRVHGFSEAFTFVGSKTQQYKQLGNTVSPGVYANLLVSIFNSVSLETPVNNKDYKPATAKRGRPLKKTVILNNHINVVKKITNTPDLGYLNLTEAKFAEYETHLANGGTLSMTVEFYADSADKKAGKIQSERVIHISALEKLGFRDKKNGIYRVKLVEKNALTVETVGKKEVLFTRPGGKGKFADKFETVHANLGLDTKKVDTVIDAFFGGGGYTLKNIETLNFNRYIINDADTLIMKTMEGVKKAPQRVIELYLKINSDFQDLFPDELRAYKKAPGRDDKVLSELRNDKHLYVKRYYQDHLSKLDNHQILDIYTVAAIYIWTSQKTTSGFFKYYDDGTISKVNFSWQHSINDKTKMIKHWSYLLNKHSVEIRNTDVFDLLKDKSINQSDSLIYLDPPYIGVDYVYNKDNSDDFQLKLLKETNGFGYRIYSNEDCDGLYGLGVDRHFTGSMTFERNNKMGQPTKSHGGKEYLGWAMAA